MPIPKAVAAVASGPEVNIQPVSDCHTPLLLDFETGHCSPKWRRKCDSCGKVLSKCHGAKMNCFKMSVYHWICAHRKACISAYCVFLCICLFFKCGEHFRKEL